MKNQQILFSTVHPAPYMDRMLEYIKSEYEITVIYNCLSDKYKQWNNYSWVHGFVFKDISFKKTIGLIRNADLVIVGGWGSWDCIKLILLSNILFKKVAVFSDCPIHVNKRSPQFWFKKLFLFKQFDYIFCATSSTQEIYSKFYNLEKSKLKLFPYAIHFPEINHIEAINKSRVNELLNGNMPRIFISNSFYKRKGYNILYEMLIEIQKKDLLYKYDITIAGLGEEYEEYEFKFKSLSSKIKFTGWLDYEDYIDQMNNTDIFIHASLFEPFGIPPIDAMARGKLLIVSDGVQSTTSIIKSGENGYIYSASEPKELVTIIENLKTESIYNIGQRAIKTANENYSYEIYSNVLKECID